MFVKSRDGRRKGVETVYVYIEERFTETAAKHTQHQSWSLSAK